MNEIIKQIAKIIITAAVSALSYFGVKHLNDIKAKKWYFITPLGIILLSVIVLVVSGCSSVKPIQIKTLEEKRQTLKPSQPAQIDLKSYNLYVVEKDQSQYFCMYVKDYESYVYNFQSLKKYIKEQQDIIKYYESHIQN